jgi:hypothetical protein
MDPTATLSADDRQFLAEALLVRRYVGHTLDTFAGGQSYESEAQAHVALQLAKRLGVFKEYWDTMQRTDVLSIRVRNLDAPRKGTPRAGQKVTGRAKYAR